VRILHVYKDYAPVLGGIENHVRLLAEGLAGRGHDVAVLVTAAGPRSSEESLGGVRVLRAGRLASLASAPLSPALAWRLGREPADVVHLHSPYPVAELGWLLSGRHPMVLTYHSDVVRQRLLGRLWAPWLELVLRRADRVLATSPVYVETSRFLRRVRERVRVVPPGIDPTRFTGIDAAAARARYGGGPTLAFVGRLRYYKGLDVLIDALTELPELRLLVVGDGPMGAAWRSRARSAGVADRVRWLGALPDDELPAVLAAADLYVLPAVARSEAFGIALVEAMAAGLPAVTTELGTGTSWVNQDGATGLVVPPGDPGALAAAVRALLADPDRRRRMGAAARRRALAEFSAAVMIDRVEQVYQEVMA
jgi:rhamnosyl/mannosyltransferase